MKTVQFNLALFIQNPLQSGFSLAWRWIKHHWQETLSRSRLIWGNPPSDGCPGRGGEVEIGESEARLRRRTGRLYIWKRISSCLHNRVIVIQALLDYKFSWVQHNQQMAKIVLHLEFCLHPVCQEYIPISQSVCVCGGGGSTRALKVAEVMSSHTHTHTRLIVRDEGPSSLSPHYLGQLGQLYLFYDCALLSARIDGP